MSDFVRILGRAAVGRSRRYGVDSGRSHGLIDAPQIAPDSASNGSAQTRRHQIDNFRRALRLRHAPLADSRRREAHSGAPACGRNPSDAVVGSRRFPARLCRRRSQMKTATRRSPFERNRLQRRQFDCAPHDRIEARSCSLISPARTLTERNCARALTNCP